MKTKEIILELRTKAGMSQDELAEKVHVTRQAVSRWEKGETIPNTETLKLLSTLFDVSINTLLGSPRAREESCTWSYPTEETWKRYADLGYFTTFQQQLMEEFNALQIEGLPKVESLNVLTGSFINLEYTLPNGKCVKFLDDDATYLGSELPCIFGGDRCFGLVAGLDFLLVCTYEVAGENPELVLYKKR